MPTITAKNTLMSLWPLIYKGRDQELSKQESEELGRLCEILKRSLPGIPGYSEAAQRFCTSLLDSGVFESGKIADAERLLENVDHLRQLLN